MDALIALWHQHWDTIVHYAATVVPWIVETKLRFLGILLSWPAVVLYLGLLIIFLFRQQLARRIDHIKSLKGPGGFAAEFEPVQKEIEPEKPPAVATPAASAGDENANLQVQINALTVALNAYTKAFNDLSIHHYFEGLLNLVFGTQWRFLVDLKASQAGLNAGVATSYFTQHVQFVQSLGLPTPAFHQWSQWLYTNELISYDGATVTFYITLKGRAFVDYVVHRYGPNGLARYF